MLINITIYPVNGKWKFFGFYCTLISKESHSLPIFCGNVEVQVNCWQRWGMGFVEWKLTLVCVHNSFWHYMAFAIPCMELLNSSDRGKTQGSVVVLIFTCLHQQLSLIPDDGKKAKCKTEVVQDSNNPLYDGKFSL